MKIPAISVIIPMFNAEKYIGDAMDSLAAQTFQDFEIIVVDDCSTDNSVEIVQKYAEKFDNRLKISRMQQNSGGGGYVPRNIGLNLSRGEYIFFLDADDFIIETAFEILYASAEKFGADVVYNSAWYSLNRDGKFNLIKDGDDSRENQTFTLDNPEKNLRKLIFKGHFRNPWTKFSRRDFLMENEIVFPKIISGGDFIWTIYAYCCSKKFLRLPIPIYFYRNYSAESVSRKKRSSEEQNYHWAAAFFKWLKSLNELAQKVDILQENPNFCAQFAMLHFKYCLICCFGTRMNLNMQEIYGNLFREFDNEPTFPFLYSFAAEQEKNLLFMQQRIAELEKINAQNRAYIAELENFVEKLLPKE